MRLAVPKSVRNGLVRQVCADAAGEWVTLDELAALAAAYLGDDAVQFLEDSAGPGASDAGARAVREFRNTIATECRALALLDEGYEWERGAVGRSGRVRRLRGGPLAQRANARVEEKLVMAGLAAQLARGRSTIYIEAGSTLDVLAKYFESTGLLVEFDAIYTTSIKTALLLGEWQERAQRPTLGHVVGGAIRRESLNLTGADGWEALGDVEFDLAFLGVSGVDSGGLATISGDEVETKRAAMDRAQHVAIVADHAKFDSGYVDRKFADRARQHFLEFSTPAAWEKVCVITDLPLKEPYASIFEEHGVEVYTPDNEPAAAGA